jgi:hypothetical protein
MYIADTGSMQFAQKYAGAWFLESSANYKVDFGFASGHVAITNPLARSALPAEPRRCSVSLLACEVDADCAPQGGTCLALAEDAVRPLYSAFKFVEAGGAPTSLWVASGYAQDPFVAPVAQTDLFLLRIPAAVDLPDNLSAVRPATAWDGNRLWLVAEHGGQLQYRIRDAGQWSGWYALSPNNVTPVGGAGVIASSAGVRIYARDAAGRIYEKQLTSAITCAAGACAWGSWAVLPSGTTGDDIAATHAGAEPVLAVRGSNDRVYANVRGTSWGSWFVIGSLLTNAAPAITYHASDGRVWITARNRDNGSLQYTRINPSTRTAEPWAALPIAAAPSAWGTAPAIVSDGEAVHLYALDAAFPQWAWQIVNNGSGWSSWRKPVGGSWGTRQPAATNINGEVNLITYWYTGGMQEVSLP